MKRVKKLEEVYVFKTFKDSELQKVSDYGFASIENAREYLEQKGFVRKYKDNEIESLALWKYDVYTIKNFEEFEVQISKMILLDYVK